MKKRLLLSLFTIVSSTAIFSQAKLDKDDSVIASKSYFKSSLSYLSNVVYQGRKDSAVILYITPSLSYVNKKGWNITAGLSYAPNPGINEIELITIETGYEHKFSKSLSTNAYAAAYFYNQFSSAVQAETNGGIGLGIDYSPQDIFNLSADAGMTLSQKPDIATTVSIGHPFYFGSTGRDWAIVPAGAIIAGSQEYYRSYYENIKFNQGIRIRQKGKGRGNGNSTNTITASKKVSAAPGKAFKILDYEITIPVTYDEKKWGLFFTPVYAIPVHPLTYYEEGSVTPITETLTSSFYFTLGGYIKL